LPVPALERAQQILDLLAQSESPVALFQLQRSLGLPKSSLHGLLTTLCDLGLASRPSDQGYWLGPKCLQWADAFSRQNHVLHAFAQAGAALAPLASESVMLTVLQLPRDTCPQVQYLACHEGQRPMGVTFRVGGSFPAACTASGKALLSTYPDEQIMAWHKPYPMPQLTERSLNTAEQLLPQMTRFRRHGYAVDDEETALGMQCFGAPVFAAGQPHAVAAVAVSMIKASLTPASRKEVSQHITALARALTESLGGGS
jgi:IclR family transcriptional regulator, blcABC operon repressor